MMLRAGSWRGLAALAAGLCVAALSARGHQVASGVAPARIGWALAVVLVASLALVGGRIRWTWWRLVAALALLQPLLHLGFAVTSTGNAHMASHHHHVHGGAVAGGGWAMVVGHVVATVAAVVVLRVGGRWLVRMPECVRALGPLVRRPALWTLQAQAGPSLILGVPRPAAVGGVRNIRGPPR